MCMCTLTYIPCGAQHFFLTSNRDEQDTRPTSLPPDWHAHQGHRFFFSRDPEAGGTWLGHTDTGRIVCLLNGAAIAHTRCPPYRRSRGLVVLDALAARSFDDFCTNGYWEGIEPFTLIFLESMPQTKIWQLRWDETTPSIQSIDPQTAHIWSSATLYGVQSQEKRRQWFLDWQNQHTRPSLSDVLWFHYQAGAASPEEAIRMRRTGGGTVSITAIERQRQAWYYHHHNLRNDKKTLKEERLPLKATKTA